MEQALISNFFSAVSLSFITVDPIGLIPVLSLLLKDIDRSLLKVIAKQVAIVTVLTSLVFFFLGEAILLQFGIGKNALKIVGGIILMIIGFEMIYDLRIHRKEGMAKKLSKTDAVSLATFPLSIPLIIGPGTMTLIIFLADEADSPKSSAAYLLGIILVVLINSIIIIKIDAFPKFIGPNVSSVLQRIFGLMIAALGTQYIIESIKAFF